MSDGQITLFGEPAPATFQRGGMAMRERVSDGKDEWLTPPEIIEALGEFDLDPCSPIKRPWPTARQHFTIEDNGLAQPWGGGRVWLNPPYGTETERWMKRMAEHGHGIALIFARTETVTWQEYIWPFASAVLFLRGRLAFCHVDGHRAQTSAGAPSALISYGESDREVLRCTKIAGFFIAL